MKYLWNGKGNKKTGCPTSTSPRSTCNPDCPHRGSTCYAEGYPMVFHWDSISGRPNSASCAKPIGWKELIDRIKALPNGQQWRMNQAGDLPGVGSKIAPGKLRDVISANKGKKGWTYTHKALSAENTELIRESNKNGFTVNLSADSLKQVDRFAELKAAPITVVIPHDYTAADLKTPAGRHVTVCPHATGKKDTCQSCGICAIAERKAIIGFPAHGVRKRMCSEKVRKYER